MFAEQSLSMVGRDGGREQFCHAPTWATNRRLLRMNEIRNHGTVSVDLPPPIVTQTPVEESTVVRRTRMRFSVASVAALIMGVALTLWSVIVLARAGFEDPLREPVVEV